MEATRIERSAKSEKVKAGAAEEKYGVAGKISGAAREDAMAALEDSGVTEVLTAVEHVGYEKKAADRIAELEKQLEDARSLAEERLSQLLRYSAELENVQKRTEREKRELVKYASEKLIRKLLSVLDSLERAACHDEGAMKIYQQLLDILKDEGLSTIPAKGEKFDPYRHEALMKVESEDLEDGSIAEELQRGYMLNSKVIRFSKVAVAGR
jgi:molecular chaperone GrpE